MVEVFQGHHCGPTSGCCLSRATNKNETQAFKLSDGFGASDDFETLIGEVLLDLGWIERLQVKQVPKQEAVDRAHGDGAKKKKG